MAKGKRSSAAETAAIAVWGVLLWAGAWGINAILPENGGRPFLYITVAALLLLFVALWVIRLLEQKKAADRRGRGGKVSWWANVRDLLRPGGLSAAVAAVLCIGYYLLQSKPGMGIFAALGAVVLGWGCAAVYANVRALWRLRQAEDEEEGEKKAENGKASDPEEAEGDREEGENGEEEKDLFMKWLDTDEPVKRPEQDYFGAHTEAAERIAERLRAEKGPESVVLYGPYGSGKTTVGHLVRHYLREGNPDEPVELVMVSAWAYEDAGALMGGILDALTDAFAPYGNVFPLKAVRRDYLRAVTGAGGALGAAAGWLSGLCGPRAVLERLDKACGRAGVRLALWLDDLDRFTRNEKERTSAGPILALLDLLKGCEHISHVLTVTDFGALGDPERLAFHFEPLNLPTEISRSLLPAQGQERGSLWKSLKTEDILLPGGKAIIIFDPIGKANRQNNEPAVIDQENVKDIGQVFREYHILSIGGGTRNTKELAREAYDANRQSLGFLLTPRKLKQVLKRMIDARDRHAGFFSNLEEGDRRNCWYGLLLLYTAEMEPGVIKNEFGDEETLAVFLRRTHQKVSGQVQSHAQNHPGEEEDFYRGRFRYCLKRAVEETLNVEQDTQRKSRLTRIFRLIYTLIELKGGYALLKEHYGE